MICALYALLHNGARAAPIWDATTQHFVGNITSLILILISYEHIVTVTIIAIVDKFGLYAVGSETDKKDIMESNILANRKINCYHLINKTSVVSE